MPEPAGERPSIVWGVGEMAPAADRKGYWGPTTSTLDWCEENYVVTLYIAEFCEWSLRRGARARAEGRLVENAEGEPGCEGRLQAGPGSGCWACAAVGSRGGPTWPPVVPGLASGGLQVGDERDVRASPGPRRRV